MVYRYTGGRVNFTSSIILAVALLSSCHPSQAAQNSSCLPSLLSSYPPGWAALLSSCPPGPCWPPFLLPFWLIFLLLAASSWSSSLICSLVALVTSSWGFFLFRTHSTSYWLFFSATKFLKRGWNILFLPGSNLQPREMPLTVMKPGILQSEGQSSSHWTKLARAQLLFLIPSPFSAIPQASSSLVTINLFSVSVSLFQFCLSIYFVL